MSRKDGDRDRKLQEKHQLALADMLRHEENKYCADCRAKGPRWASWNLGIFMCIRCAGIHRNLGVHISRVKSVNLDSWTPEQIDSISSKGNAKAAAMYEANLPAGFRRPVDDYSVESFIRAKYERKLYISKSPVASSSSTSKDTKSKSPPSDQDSRSAKKATSPSSSQLKPVARPSSSSTAGEQRKRSPQPKPTSSSTPQPTQPAKASPKVDLLTDQPVSDVPAAPASSQSAEEPLLMQSVPLNGPQASVKDSILSLYSAQPVHPSTGVCGASSLQLHQQQLFQQQQVALMKMQQQHHTMMQQQAVVQQQVADVNRHMAQLRFNQQQQQQSQSTSSGETLNPLLW